jgi:hypothetical protein
MIVKLLFIAGFVWILLRLVQRERLALDLASLTLILIVAVMGFSFSPYLVERVAAIFQFGRPSMAVVALLIAGLVAVSVTLSIMVTDLKRAQARLIRQMARMEMKNSKNIGIHAVSKDILDILPQPR